MIVRLNIDFRDVMRVLRQMYSRIEIGLCLYAIMYYSVYNNEYIIAYQQINVCKYIIVHVHVLSASTSMLHHAMVTFMRNLLSGSIDASCHQVVLYACDVQKGIITKMASSRRSYARGQQRRLFGTTCKYPLAYIILCLDIFIFFLAVIMSARAK